VTRLREALALADLWDDGALRAFVLGMLGRTAFEQERYVEAERWWREKLDLYTDLEHRYTRAFGLLSLASLKQAQHDYTCAVAIYCEALTSFASLSVISGVRLGLQGLASVADLLHRPEEASWLGAAVSLGWTESIGDPVVSRVLWVAQSLVG
jgi:hypothetical protein